MINHYEQDLEVIKNEKCLTSVHFKTTYPDIYDRIMKWDDKIKDYNFAYHLIWYVLNLHEFPICKVCGNPVYKSIAMYQYKTNPEFLYLCSNTCSNKNRVAKMKEFYMSKYGVPNPSCLQSIKDKKKKTCIEHYGVSNPSQVTEIQNKKKVTNFERYGNENAMKSDIIKERLKNRMIEKYGEDNAMKVEKFVEKLKATNRKRHGSDWYLGTEKCVLKTRETCREKYGVEWISEIPAVKEKSKDKRITILYDKKLESIIAQYELGDILNNETK